jgi:Osmosensitive K+ channel histidine kinase
MLKRGQDVVIGHVESHGREEIDEQIGRLKIILHKKIQYSKIVMEEMYTEGLLRKKNVYNATVITNQLHV